MKRMIGMLMTDPSKDPRGLWLAPCRSIHTVGMRRPLDVLFLDRSLRVVKINRLVRPLCLGIISLKAHSVVEFFSDFWDGREVTVGDQLEIKEEKV